MERIAQFHAGFFKITTDREGESRVIFEVPLSDMPQVTKLLLTVGEKIIITVDRE